MTLEPKRFLQTVSYEVGDMAQGPYAAWRAEAARTYASLPGLLSWQVLHERTGARRYTEVFVFEDREAYQATQQDAAIRARIDDLLERLGAIVEIETVDIRYHDVMPPPPAPTRLPRGG